MRTRSSNAAQSSGKDWRGGAGRDNETLADMSRDAVDKLVRRVNKRRSSGANKQDNQKHSGSASVPESGSERNGKQVIEERVTWNDLDSQHVTQEPIVHETEMVHGESLENALQNTDAEMDDIDWEDGSTPILDPASTHPSDCFSNLIIEFSESPDSAKRKPARRATAEEKEIAQLVHKVHLLCLLGRGRIIDRACDDPLIQAALLSILPAHLSKISDVSTLHADALSPLVHWFHNYFHVRSSGTEKRSFQSALASALETREGTIEELAALSVALFRALNLTTRFVSILDVLSLKPENDRCESSSQDAREVRRGIFSTSTLMVDREKEVSTTAVKSSLCKEKDKVCETKVSRASKDSFLKSRKSDSKNSPAPVKLKDHRTDSLPCDVQDSTSETCTPEKPQGSKRKGDLEFEMQLQMALSATAVSTSQSCLMTEEPSLNSNSSNVSSPFKRIKKVGNEESTSQGFSTAVGARKMGSPLHWAEVYCGGENLTGKWVHVDAVHGIIDGEQKVEAAAAACKSSLRYVAAFAGSGAKDVTRRYCIKWYKISSQRVNSVWWDAVLAPLRELESGATGGMIHLTKHLDGASHGPENLKELRGSDNPTRSTLEDMELETRVLTEPLPTNQQAYKNHPLYAIERWLTNSQLLRPKGPVLGFCSGHPVYPRSSVQSLKTKERWLREGLQVKAKELPAKVVKQSGKAMKPQFSGDFDCDEADSKATIELYGKWQLEPLQLPRAINGIVPKNERGQVDVWSEKCLPPGTVHLRLPRVFYVAKRLEIDYAPAMVGFEFRNGRSVPVYDGIVVCAEFKDAILEVNALAYAEEEERREAAEKKRNEAQAVSRWYQLLSSIITRQRLKNRYGSSSSTQLAGNLQGESNQLDTKVGSQQDAQTLGCEKEGTREPKSEYPSAGLTDDHEHVFLAEDQSFDEEASVRTKRCRCGFSVQVEEL
ncbi:hypothetical protein Tsubulata_023393 [Turnera subulata]|uniref:DNA repair protein RAD4 n=1 Tax=Turnera subulata TaxID=218843 RepID=A0A9Q0F9P4_9ROSI|nr:hypothetical protein Tsubulata_023393 [Turnera subulata]